MSSEKDPIISEADEVAKKAAENIYRVESAIIEEEQNRLKAAAKRRRIPLADAFARIVSLERNQLKLTEWFARFMGH